MRPLFCSIVHYNTEPVDCLPLKRRINVEKMLPFLCILAHFHNFRHGISGMFHTFLTIPAALSAVPGPDTSTCELFCGKLRDFPTVSIGNVKKCAVGKHPKSEKHGNTAQFSEVERSGTQENCGGIGSGCRLRLRPLPVLRRRQSQRVARIDPNAVVVDKNIAENDRFDLFSR